jgi:hypothetical protein
LESANGIFEFVAKIAAKSAAAFCKFGKVICRVARQMQGIAISKLSCRILAYVNILYKLKH